eukprot:CAMPEP_0172489894 /NCGR_PEP_ID=MMETSP1066-20121228/20164_1 /TAXON_ID=671091 /ORGANISM="Coscinodiscus wailesii, Strain CCMP2513" /LENGTH=606 /DNA_ID=CAMNT_0013258085 /DNA_START=279 /DNA_END=2099 /DNA_ORIENTATION=+
MFRAKTSPLLRTLSRCHAPSKFWQRKVTNLFKCRELFPRSLAKLHSRSWNNDSIGEGSMSITVTHPGSHRQVAGNIPLSPLFFFFSSQSRRQLSTNNSRKNSSSKSSFQLDALPFSLPPTVAFEKFQTWAGTFQGLSSYLLLAPRSIRLTPSYVPVWSFDVNLRFKTVLPRGGGVTYRKKPEPFLDAYEGSDIVHLPGLSVYAGYSYRRSVINAVHETSLVFLGRTTVPFDGKLLRDMDVGGEIVSIFPDPWNATKGRAYSLLVAELTEEFGSDGEEEGGGSRSVEVELVTARRVYMPTYVIDYSVLGFEYRAFLSGCDDKAPVAGVSHVAFDFLSKDDVQRISEGVARGGRSLWRFAERSGGPWGVVLLLQWVLNGATKVLTRIPSLFAKMPLLLGGTFVGFRKVIRPWMDNRLATAEWERQREHEAIMREEEDHFFIRNDFRDRRGSAKRYFERNRVRILKHLAGDEDIHTTHDDTTSFDWYKQWEEWARRQWKQQQQYENHQQKQQQYENQQQKQQQTKQKTYKQKTTKDYKWDFDPNDPYSVLGIHRGASKEDVSRAFRKEMLKYHPDTQGATVSNDEKERAVERSKLITAAYRKIKVEMKR